MAKKAMGLGRGLDSLFGDTEEWDLSGMQEIPVGELDINPDQPRKNFDEENLEMLAESIRDQGVLQPLIVAATSNGRYRIIAGERRYRASRIAGLEKVPCIVRDLDIVQQMEIALIENLQREDLNPVDAARGIRGPDAAVRIYPGEGGSPAGKEQARCREPAADAESAGGNYGYGSGGPAELRPRQGACGTSEPGGSA